MSLSLSNGTYACEPVIAVCSCNSFPPGSTQRQLELTLNFGPDSSVTITRKLSWAVTSPEVYNIDISSSIRSVIGEYTSPDSKDLSIPGINLIDATLTGKYLLNGDVGSTAAGTLTAVDGGSSVRSFILAGRSELDRLIGTTFSTLSRKPSLAERVFEGFISFSTTDAGAVTRTTISNSGENTTGYYIESYIPGRHYEFVFINSLGAYESCVAVCLPTEKLQVSRKEFRRVSSPTVSDGVVSSPSPTLLNVTGDVRSVLDMSSGAVEYEWAKWWAEEFIGARRHWMKVGSHYIPVTVTPKQDAITIVDRSKAEASSIDFTVKLGVSGMI